MSVNPLKRKNFVKLFMKSYLDVKEEEEEGAGRFFANDDDA
jgi:hypothetical protein